MIYQSTLKFIPPLNVNASVMLVIIIALGDLFSGVAKLDLTVPIKWGNSRQILDLAS